MSVLKRSVVSIGIIMLCFISAVTIQGKTTTISKKNFPDSYIRKVVKKYDKNHDGKLSTKEQKKVKTLSVSKRKQVNLKGIRKLGYLTEVKLYKVKVKNTNELAHVKNMKFLKVQNTDISAVHLKSSQLREVTLKQNSKLLKVNLSGCSRLNKVYVSDNQKLKTLDLHQCKSLKELTDISNKALKELNLLGSSNLKYYSTNVAKNKKVKMDKMKNLSEIDIWGSDCMDVDYSKIENVKIVKFHRCTINDSIFGQLSNLSEIYFDECKSQKSLDYSKLKKLRILSSYYSYLGDELNLSGLTKLKKLSCPGNKIKTFILGDALALTEIDLSCNNLSGDIYFAKVKKLEKLDIGHNKLRKLDLNGCNKLSELICCKGNLKVLDMRDIEHLVTCDITGNPDVEIYINGEEFFPSFSTDDFAYDKTAIIFNVYK